VYSEDSVFRATPIFIRRRRVGQIGHLWMGTIDGPVARQDESIDGLRQQARLTLQSVVLS